MTYPFEAFDEIRPYHNDEICGALDELECDAAFRDSMERTFESIPFEMLIAKARQCRTLLDIQKTFVYPFLKQVLAEHADGLTSSMNNLDKSKNYTFISNHRDIVLDSAFLCVSLIDNNFSTTVEMATGDNLLTVPWIKKLVRLNKGLIVKRALGLREQLLSSDILSQYIHYAVNEKKENVWIAQRQGRAKDSNDFTQKSLLKMLCMGNNSELRQSLKGIHVVPLTISYEYDPCDYLKAKEFQQKRDNPDFKKTRDEDVNSMETGIFGYKGQIHYQTAACLDEWIETLPENICKNDFFNEVAAYMDHCIHSNYRMYPNNYIAADFLEKGTRFASKYTEEQKAKFQKYLQGQLAKIDLEQPDLPFLTEKILSMYANPLYNHLAAIQSK